MQPGPGADVPERTFIETARRAQIVAAAIDTIAEVGYARASLGRIAGRIGISRGLISYHFAGKDELMTEVISEVVAQARDYMEPRIFAESTGPAMVRTYIESNLAFMREHRNYLIAVVEILRHRVATGGPRRVRDPNSEVPARPLVDLLARAQAASELREDFDPRTMAIAIRAAIDAAPPLMSLDPEFDIDSYAKEIANAFERATRIDR
jgi:AcrR family transcriptional regulator